MKFWLLETDIIGCTIPNKEIDFPEITEDMVEEDEHLEILNKYLNDKNLNSITSVFSFDEDREIYTRNLVQENVVLKQKLVEAISLLNQTIGLLPDTAIGFKIDTYFNIRR